MYDHEIKTVCSITHAMPDFNQNIQCHVQAVTKHVILEMSVYLCFIK